MKVSEIEMLIQLYRTRLMEDFRRFSFRENNVHLCSICDIERLVRTADWYHIRETGSKPCFVLSGI